MCYGSINKFYGAVAGDRKNLVINIQIKEGNTNLDIFKKKKRKIPKIVFHAVTNFSH